jgi:hypothetical protein
MSTAPPATVEDMFVPTALWPVSVAGVRRREMRRDRRL